MRIICSSVSGFLNSVPLIRLVQDPFFVPQLFLLPNPKWELNFKKTKKSPGFVANFENLWEIKISLISPDGKAHPTPGQFCP